MDRPREIVVSCRAWRAFILVAVLIIGGCFGRHKWEPTIQDHELSLPQHSLPEVGSVSGGFRGDQHAMLSADTSLRVNAVWTPIGHGRAFTEGYFPLQFYEPFRQLKVIDNQRIYTAKHFSVFLPEHEDISAAGEVWRIDVKRAAQFLTQFHPAISTHINSTGRLSGPDGGFAIVRALSPDYVEIAFRIHAEIEPEEGVFYTPAHFSGFMTINKQTKRVERFRLAIPTESLNATLTVALPTEALVDIVHVERMELSGSLPDANASIPWMDEIDEAEAALRLKRLFYGFMEIKWVPFEQAVAIAQTERRPLFAVVLWGRLDEQSC